MINIISSHPHTYSNIQINNISFIMTSIKEMDQNNWVCYKFGDCSYYYGELGLLDTFGVVHPKDNAELAADPKVKLVKHGFGLYIYDDPTGSVRYEGNWAKDQKNGKGLLKFKDGSQYEGQFKDGYYHDSGIFKWANGDIYDGRWKKGRMEGPGLFKRHDGLSLKGSFKNNYFIDSNNLRNPFMSEQEYEQLKKRRKQITKQYEKNEKIKNGYFERVKAQQLGKLANLVQKSTKNNRVALITASEQSGVSFGAIKQNLKSGVHLIDLRKSYKLEGEQKYNYIKEVEEVTQKCIKNGGVLLLSLDESESVQQFEELFYPEVRQLYSPNGFNSAVWAPKDLQKAEIRNKIIGNSEVSDKFCFAVWSKVKLSQTLSDDFLREKIQKRFESVVPFIKIDMILVEKGKGNEEKAQQGA